MSRDDILSWSVLRILDAYSSGELRPPEYLEACLERIEETRSTVNAVGDVYADEARAGAEEATKRWRAGSARALEGIPIAVKDEASIAGKRVTNGSLLYENNFVGDTEPMVQRLLDAGGIVHARTLTPEFSIAFWTHSRMWGVTRNPWNLAYDVGGSSGGSAAALACGAAPIATGSDIGGSIRMPASVCGVVGYKPPHGRVPIPGIYGLDDWCHQGPLARSVRDCALVTDVMSGSHALDHSSFIEEVVLGRPAGDVRHLRVAVSPDLGDWPVVDEVRQAVATAAGALRSVGATVEPVELVIERELLRRASNAHYRAVFAADVAATVRGHEKDVNPYTLNWLRLVQQTPETFVEGRQIEVEIWRRVSAVLSDYDVLLTANLCIAAFAAGVDYTIEPYQLDGVDYESFHDLCLTEVFNVTNRCPVLSVPAGRSGEGVPIGVQIVGRPYLDAPVFEVGAALENAAPWPVIAPAAG
jgi:aspartyl-tRNA(Asn)/glutamyl-tRNA(Gln) amidotransferase subunit A